MRAEPVHVRLGPETHPHDERVEAWRAALGFSHDVAGRPVDRADFRAGFDGHHLGAVMIADMRANTLVATRDAALIARHAFAVALDRVQEGALVGRSGDAEVARRARATGVPMDARDTERIDAA